MTAAIRLRAVAHRFGGTTVLRGVDLRVDPGERVAITGANGVGKTTLLKLIAGLLRPDTGDVTVLGGTLRDPRVRARIGFVGHQPFLYPRLTARENLRFWARMYGSTDDGVAVLRHLGLDADDTRPVSAFSQGMRRRVALASALGHDPELLLLDEPFAGLDDAGVSAVAGLLTDGGRTVVFATHAVDQPAPRVDRLLTLHDGRLER